MCHEAGKYTLQFDNSFSLLTKKKVSYRTLLIAPEVVSAVALEAPGPAEADVDAPATAPQSAPAAMPAVRE